MGLEEKYKKYPNENLSVYAKAHTRVFLKCATVAVWHVANTAAANYVDQSVWRKRS